MNRLRSGAIPADPVLTGRAVARVTPTTTNPLAVFQAKYQGGSNGVQVDITAGVAMNALSIRLLRGFNLDPKRAKMVQSWAGPFALGDNLEYLDNSAQVTSAVKAYYWAQIVYEQTPNLTEQTFGPQTAFINAIPGGSEQIPAFSVSISPNGGVLDVVVSFQLPDSSDFGYANVYFTGYNGIQAPQLVAQGSSSPFTFTVQPTGETVTVQVDAVTVGGVAIANGTTQPIHLAAANTLPAIIFNGTAISNTVGNQITFPGSLEKNVTAMKVYRQASGGVFPGTLIATIAPTPEKSYTVTDQIASPQNFIYFITATNSVGESLPSPAIIPGQANSNSSRGTGATAISYVVSTPGLTGTTSFVAGCPIISKGTNYFALPLITIDPPGSGSGNRTATAVAILDGAGGIQAIQMTDNGVYNSGDTPAVSIHY